MTDPAKHTTGARLREEMQRYRAAQAAALAEPSTENDVFVLIGHAMGLSAEGKQDMPAYFMDLAERIATARGDSVMAQRVRELVTEHGIGAAGPASSKQEQALDALANDGLVAELERQPDAWAVFAEVRGQMTMQWPPRLTKEDAERDAEFYLPGTKTKVRPLYAGPADPQNSSPKGAQA